MSWPIGQLARAMHPPSAVYRLLAMIKGYFDESTGHNDDPRAFTLAGYLATADAWVAFEARWARMLSDAGVSEFHMKDYEPGWGEFRGWTPEKRLAVISAAADAIVQSELFGFSCTVHLPEFTDIMAPRIQPGSKDEPLREPYVFCLHGCLQAIDEQMRHFALPPEPVALVFDRRQRIIGKSEALWDTLVESRGWQSLFDDIDFALKRWCRSIGRKVGAMHSAV